MMTLGQFHEFLPGSRLLGDPATPLERVHTDTRSLQAGDLFVALRGERFDAHEFLAQARHAGAVAALAEHGIGKSGLPGVEVRDSRAALGQLATAWRGQFALQLIAVTGSNGKTTLTQMIASILRAWKRDASMATVGNLNNDIGVPLTLLRLRAGHQVAVVELGMNHPGEIAHLATMAQPTVAVVNNAQREHQEFMASVEAVAQENGAVLAALPPDGVCVFPADDSYTPLWRALAGQRRVLSFAAQGDADITADAQWQQGAWAVQAKTPAGPLTFKLHVAGRHNVKNALAAIACALAAGAPTKSIGRGLAAFEPVKGRSRALKVQWAGQAGTLIDDTYNANPDSVRAAIDVLADLPGPHLLVLGDMGEVGDQGPAFHAEAGDYARERGIETLMTLGEQAVGMGGQHFGSMEMLNAAVLDGLPAVRSVLVKGSRFMKMERVVQAIVEHADKNRMETPHVA